MRYRWPGSTSAAVAVVGVLCDSPAAPPAPTMLTIPQRDQIRPRYGDPTVSISADGRYVAFSSYARLSPLDDDNRADIYVLDRETGVVSFESESADGRALVTDCGHPRISGDGRYLAFDGSVDGEHPPRNTSDVLLRDRIAKTARRVSVGPNGEPGDGWSSSPAISSDGRSVAFTSTATNLVSGLDTNGPRPDIYVFRADRHPLQRVSVDTAGGQLRGGSVTPAISADGRFVVFASITNDTATRQAQPVIDRVFGIFLRDLQSGQTKELTASGHAANGTSMTPVISGDGKYVAFVSRATNLVSGDRNRSMDVFLYDVATGTVTAVSRAVGGGTANGVSVNPAISVDGSLVLFQSDASDMACARCAPDAEDINLLPDVFLFERATGRVTCLSTGDDGGWMEESGAPALDASGDVIAFTSRHPISPQDASNDFDLFVRIADRR